MGLPFCYSSCFVKSSTRQVGVCSRRSICPDTGYGVDYSAGILSALVHRDQHQFPGRPTLKTCLRTKTQLLRNGEQAPERNLLPPEDTFLSCTDKVAEKLVKIPVQVRFNKDCTTIQIAAAESESSVTFPKSGRKAIPNAVKILKENRIPFSVIFSGALCEDAAKWRGERRINPTDVLLQTTRGTKKK